MAQMSKKNVFGRFGRLSWKKGFQKRNELSKKGSIYVVRSGSNKGEVKKLSDFQRGRMAGINDGIVIAQENQKYLGKMQRNNRTAKSPSKSKQEDEAALERYFKVMAEDFPKDFIDDEIWDMIEDFARHPITKDK